MLDIQSMRMDFDIAKILLKVALNTKRWNY